MREGGQVDRLLFAARTCACTALVVSCKEEQFFDETLHVLGFVFDAAYPFHLLGDLGLRMCCDDVGVGENDGERCLELVRCVGDELRLLVPGAFDGPGNEMSEQYAHEGHGNQRECEDGQDSHHGRSHRGEKRTSVSKGHDEFAVFIGMDAPKKPQVSVDARTVGLLEGPLDCRGAYCL